MPLAIKSSSTQFWEPVDHLQGPLGPSGPETPKKSEKVSGASGPRTPESLEKVSKSQTGKGLEKVPKDFFETFFPDSRGAPGPEAPLGCTRSGAVPLATKLSST